MHTPAPRIRPVSRRTFIKTAAVAASIVGAPFVWRKTSAQAKRIVIRDSGGPFSMVDTDATPSRSAPR